MTKIMNNKANNLIRPEVPIPSISLYMKWGESKIRQLVRYHHYLLRLHDDKILPIDNSEFEFVNQKISDFVVETLKHGQYSNLPFNFPILKMRHYRKLIDVDTRDVWLTTYKKAILDTHMPSQCIEEFWNWIESLSVWMINNRPPQTSIPRYCYKDIWTDFVEFQTIHRCG